MRAPPPTGASAASDAARSPVAAYLADPAPVFAAAEGVPLDAEGALGTPRVPQQALAPSLAAQGVPSHQVVHSGVLKLRGLPFSATKEDIIAFFDEPQLGIAPLVHDSIHIVTSLDGRPSGTAFAEFASAEDAKAAMMRKDRHSMGSRYVELFASSRDEATRAATAAR